jgi:hypothetical protein
MTTVKSRHVLCVLGNWANFDDVKRVVARAGGAGFELDEEYSLLEPDERMAEAFEASADRVEPSFGPADQKAVADHRAVAYVLSPPVTPETAAQVSARALSVVRALLEAGGVAAKAESAGIAHGMSRWIELAANPSPQALQRAFVRRPLGDEDDGVYYSCGMHLLGRRDLEVPDGIADRAAVELMDLAAPRVLAARPGDDLEGTTLNHPVLGEWQLVDGGECARYGDDEFFFNPHGYWGIVPVGDGDEDYDDDDDDDDDDEE